MVDHIAQPGVPQLGTPWNHKMPRQKQEQGKPKPVPTDIKKPEADRG